jgi:hypothetical protein
MPPFRWEDIDHRLAVLKLIDLSEEMRSRIKEDESRIRLENRLNQNSNTVPSLILQMKVERADEWARREYEIYCSVWQTQGYVKSAAFVRGVCAHIIQMLGVRAKSIANEFSRFGRGTNFPIGLRTAHLNSLERRMRQLQGRWHRRLEIEAKECEHAERTKNLKTISTISTSSPENQTQVSVQHHSTNTEILDGARSRARFPPIRSSAPLSEFEATVAKLMMEARGKCRAKHLPQAEILEIAVLLDEKQFPVRTNLERAASRAMAEYNKQHSKGAIKTWEAASKLPQFRRAVRKRFSRAEEKYRKAIPLIASQSAGPSRTTI